MRRTGIMYVLVGLVAVLCAGPASAHFGMIIPSTDNVGPKDDKEIALTLVFTHPFENGPVMNLEKPEKFGVAVDGSVEDLLAALKEKKADNGKTYWTAKYAIKRPGDYAFFMLPKPYWEPAEDKFIVHATKVIVDALNAEEGWDAPIAEAAGLPCEIVPLTRPYSLYKGNVFTGRVMMNGKPVTDAEVEVEWRSEGKGEAPTDSHVTQVVKADSNGVFSFAMPKMGWWGFAALMEGPEKIEKDGEKKDVEIGAVLWVYAYPMK